MEKVIHYCWFGDKPLPKLAKKCIKSWKKYLPDFKIIKWSEENVDLNECAFIKGAYENRKWAFVADYVRAKALNEYGGIYFDTDMEIIKDISGLLEDKTFLGIEDSGYVAAGVWYEREKGSNITTEMLKRYRDLKVFEIEKMVDFSIPKILTELLKPRGLKKGLQQIQNLDEGIKIYPRDYFYPYGFYRDNNMFTDNTCMIHYYDASWIPAKDKRDMILIRIFGRERAISILRNGSKIKWHILHVLRIPLFPIVLYRRHKKIMAQITPEYLERLNATIDSIKSYSNADYIAFHNKNWLGVTSSTKENFQNTVDCNEIIRKKDAKLIANAVLESNIKQVIFSGFALGASDIVKFIKKKNKNIKIKTLWHGSNSQVLDAYAWERNLEIIHLHKKGYIDVMGTCKQSLLDFYKKHGFNAFFISNKVTGIDSVASPNNSEGKIKIGIYASRCNYWCKNMYSQMGAVSLIDNAVLDMVPLNDEAIKFSNQYGIEISGIKNPIPRDELLQRMAQNDVNLYVTASECAPMLPLESMEQGVPCITGNNHHYFKNKELEKYLVINNETDIEEIKEKILLCCQKRDEIISLYKEFSKENLELNNNQIQEFLKM